jgi:hypothetical protein
MNLEQGFILILIIISLFALGLGWFVIYQTNKDKKH